MAVEVVCPICRVHVMIPGPISQPAECAGTEVSPHDSVYMKPASAIASLGDADE